MPTDREGSLFQRLFAGPAGIDPYAAAVSDVYQDLFGEGSYTGKGIYDVDAFAAALAGRVPENALLSHDLFEGIFARTGLVTDLELFEEFPSHYESAASAAAPLGAGRLAAAALDPRTGPGRRPSGGDPAHRPMEDAGQPAPDAVGPRGMADARRELDASPWRASPVDETRARRHRDARPDPRLHGDRAGASGDLQAQSPSRARPECRRRRHSDRTGHHLPCPSSLADERRRRADARPSVRHATAAARVDTGGAGRIDAVPRSGRFLSKTCAARYCWPRWRRRWSSFIRPANWIIAAPFVLLWGALPARGSMDQPPARAPDRRRCCRRTRPGSCARRHDARGGSSRHSSVHADHFLPPDNFQEDPKPVVAHRTSPTNMGLYLLSTVGARDLGWAGTIETLERLEATLATMGRLERFRGHLYNWYGTDTLRPLEPRYVSTVDSGNLAGHLLVVGQCLPGRVPQGAAGARDAGGDRRRRAARRGGHEESGRRPANADRDHGSTSSRRAGPWSTAIGDVPPTPAEWVARLRRLAAAADTLVDIAQTLTAERGDDERSEVLVWARAVRGDHREPRARRRGHDAMGASTRVTARRALGRAPEAVEALRSLAASPVTPGATCTTAASAAAAELRKIGGARGGARLEAAIASLGALGAACRSAHRSPVGGRRDHEGSVRHDAVRLPLRPHPEDLLDRLPGHGRKPRSRRIRPPRLRGASRQLHRDREGGRARVALVPPRPADDAGGPGRRARLLVRLDVRVPDAGPRHEGSTRQPARADLPVRRAAPDELWGRSRGAVGHLGIGLQRARSRSDVPVLELRHSRSGARARTQRGSGRRALRDRARGDGGPAGRRSQFRAPGRRRRPRALRLLRGARLHALPPSRKESPWRSFAPTWRTTRA